MKKLLLFWIFIVGGIFCASAQLNPIRDLHINQGYDLGNFLNINWQTPETSADTLVGYNVYRETELYRFQEATSLYFDQFGGPSNADVGFLFFHDMDEFYSHITAVYGIEHRESIYNDSVLVGGPLLNTEDLKNAKPVIFPNPTEGLLTINSQNINSVAVYDLNGKLIETLEPQKQIDLSSLKPGIYILKFATDEGSLVQKLVIK